MWWRSRLRRPRPELRAPPAVPPALARRWRGSGWRCRSVAGAGAGECRRDLAGRGALLAAVGFAFTTRHWSVSPLVAGRERARKTRCAASLRRSRAKAGGRGTHCAGAEPGTSTRSRSLRVASRSRSRRRREATTRAISLACTSRRPGCPAAGDGGAATAPSPSCASSGHVAWSAVSTVSLWSRSIS